MRELRLIFGWLIQIVGILLFLAALGTIIFQLQVIGLFGINIKTFSWWEFFKPSLVCLIPAIPLTWLGLRLRRDL